MTSETRDSTSFGCLLKSHREQSIYSFLGRVLGANRFRCSLPAAVYPLLGNPQQMPLMHLSPSAASACLNFNFFVYIKFAYVKIMM